MKKVNFDDYVVIIYYDKRQTVERLHEKYTWRDKLTYLRNYIKLKFVF